jgi:hypothetical protein
MTKNTIPGAALKKVDADAHAATYDESGDLAIKHDKPVAEVEGKSQGTADTGVSAKIQEPLTGPVIEQKDTVDPASVKTEGAAIEEGVKETAAQKAEREEKEKVADALNIDDTEAAKAAEKSQAAQKAANKKATK